MAVQCFLKCIFVRHFVCSKNQKQIFIQWLFCVDYELFTYSQTEDWIFKRLTNDWIYIGCGTLIHATSTACRLPLNEGVSSDNAILSYKVYNIWVSNVSGSTAKFKWRLIVQQIHRISLCALLRTASRLPHLKFLNCHSQIPCFLLLK